MLSTAILWPACPGVHPCLTNFPWLPNSYFQLLWFELFTTKLPGKSDDKCRQHVEKQRHYSADKGSYSQGYSMVFLVVMYDFESWTIKKPLRQRIDAFKLWCWGRLLKGPWTERRSNQSILREINREYSLKGLILKLKLQDFGHPMHTETHWKSPWYCERLRVEGKEGLRGWDGWMALPMQWTWTRANFRRWWETERSGVLQSVGSQRVRYNWATEQQQLVWMLWWLSNGIMKVSPWFFF